ncbi:cytochrome c-type biogenesis protein CcmH [Vibrio sp. Of7-15]|uniref:cytochrome c-type biogenesis protein n=1 Tax=Vibrio sp. Of7-15 TaxID=2724879 RepID=UPI001EF2A698|nr:cytochrome c-type biogenesis protein [Vibrio sp. Of7-15]MCG7499119.1 cytochrome c-type biogenesis protein CcmH [Vibrio sp. Of7-15]
MKRLATLLLSAFLVILPAYAAIDVYEFDTPEQEQQFKELGNTIRCPKCQNNTIADSNAELAQDLRQKVYEMTKEGKSEGEIIDYMIARYGNFVTYDPPMTPATLILWLGPLSVVVFGFTFIFLRSRKSKAQLKDQEDWDAEHEARLKALLDEEKEDGKVNK